MAGVCELSCPVASLVLRDRPPATTLTSDATSAGNEDTTLETAREEAEDADPGKSVKQT